MLGRQEKFSYTEPCLTRQARAQVSTAPAVPYDARQVVHGSGGCRIKGIGVSSPWLKGPKTFAPFDSGHFSMVHHVMTAGVSDFAQITQVYNVGAAGDGNSVSGSKASSAHAFPAGTNRNPRKGTR